MFNTIKKYLWDSFFDSSQDILKQIQVLTVSKMKDNLKTPSKDLSIRSGDLARDIQGDIVTSKWGMQSDKLGGVGQEVSAKRIVTAPNAFLVTEGVYQVTDRQKAFFRFLSIKERGGGQHTPLSRLYQNMGNPKTVSRIFGRPLVEESIEEVKWTEIVLRNIKNRVPTIIERIHVG